MHVLYTYSTVLGTNTVIAYLWLFRSNNIGDAISKLLLLQYKPEQPLVTFDPFFLLPHPSQIKVPIESVHRGQTYSCRWMWLATRSTHVSDCKSKGAATHQAICAATCALRAAYLALEAPLVEAAVVVVDLVAVPGVAATAVLAAAVLRGWRLHQDAHASRPRVADATGGIQGGARDRARSHCTRRDSHWNSWIE